MRQDRSEKVCQKCSMTKMTILLHRVNAVAAVNYYVTPEIVFLFKVKKKKKMPSKKKNQISICIFSNLVNVCIFFDSHDFIYQLTSKLKLHLRISWVSCLSFLSPCSYSHSQHQVQWV